ncbi:MAG: hypothetical protein HY863_19315 [Chloroflexi bacterium]|nr:hypothetical protein [Chloroflexota bacterium]
MTKKQRLFISIAGFILLTACNLATATPTLQVDLPSPTAPSLTPPGPATATQTLTPAPTLTATPFPMYFTEEFNSDLNGWETFQTGGSGSPSAQTENSFLRIDIAAPNTWYYAILNVHEYSNVTVSAKIDGNPGGSIGLVCYYNETKGWYEFNVASDGTYGVLFGQWLAEDIAQYTPIANDTTSHLEAGSLNYEIGMACQANDLLLYVDGALFRKLDVSRYGLIEGMVGITASSFDEIPMTSFFDWVRVSEK